LLFRACRENLLSHHSVAIAAIALEDANNSGERTGELRQPQYESKYAA
jgi:hypothetical protein